MEKLRYEIDPHNKLVVRRTGKKTDVFRFRYVLDGRFRIGRDNTLLYHIKAPSRGIAKELNLPHQLKLRGDWSLTKDYNLRLTLDKWRRQAIGDEITLEASVIRVEAHSLLFAITQRTSENTTSTYILKFGGTWQADRNNRLTFRVRRERGDYDILTFDGIWEINNRHKIFYSYEKQLTARKTRSRHSLLFDGFWNITKRYALTYQLDAQGESAFNFRVGHGIVEGNAIKFELGVGTSQKKVPARKSIVLYGNWQIKKGRGLLFEMEYGKGRIVAIRFETEVQLVGSSRVRLSLKSEGRRDLGLVFTISKTLLGGSGESFIRMLCNREEKAIYVGTGFTW